MRKSLGNPMLQQSPYVPYWIQIRRICRPDHLVHTVRLMVLLRQLSRMLRSTVFHEDCNLPRIFWVASHPLHESIYKRKNVFSIHTVPVIRPHSFSNITRSPFPNAEMLP